LDERLKGRLRMQAARHGHSMEEEARVILRTALRCKREKSGSLGASIRAKVAKFGGANLRIPPRAPMPPPLEFES
jgi:plasmid stability protein